MLAVLGFHSGWGEPFDGGYLGVSVFFVLSGFLITQILLTCSTSSIEVARFLGRRVWRLVPAATVTLAGSLAAWRVWGIGGDREPEAIRWAALHARNWFELQSDRSYLDAFDRPGLTDHFWSLAIEEQFYLLLPAAVVAIAWRHRQLGSHIRTRSVAPRVAVGGAVVVAASWWFARCGAAAGATDLVYFHTASRAGELAVGVVAGCWIVHRWPLASAASASAIRDVTTAALAAVVVVCVVAADATESSWPYTGQLPIFAIVCALLLATLTARSPIGRLLGSGPLVWIGRRSYALYLFHWPVFLIVDHHLPSRPGIAHDLIGWSISFVLAAISLRWIEQPLRTDTHRPWMTVLLALGAPAAIVAATLVVNSKPPTPPNSANITATTEQKHDVASDEPRSTIAAANTAPQQSVEVAAQPTANAATETDGRTTLLFGDSTAVALAPGLTEWARSVDVDLHVVAHGGCGIVRQGSYDVPILDAALQIDYPALHDVALPAALAAHVDHVVIMISLADTWTRSWDNGDTWLRPTDPAYADRLRHDYRTFVSHLVDAGVETITWTRPPVTLNDNDRDGSLEPEVSYTDGSQDLVTDIVTDLADDLPITILDLRQMHESGTITADSYNRPDGIHITPESSTVLARHHLGPLLVDLWDDAGRAG